MTAKEKERYNAWKQRAKEAEAAKRSLERDVERLQKQLRKEQGDFSLGVRPISNEVGRYEVRSRSKGDQTHLVDLLSRGALGECSCEYWMFNARINSENRKLELGELGERYRPIPYGFEGACLCAHLQAARARFTEEFLQKLAKLAEKQGDDDGWHW
jgi:hypothetical protein